jgi:outer membrane beta-barrel protein
MTPVDCPSHRRSRMRVMVNKFIFALFSFLFIAIAPPLAFAAEGDTYNFSWLDPDKEVYVLQNRKYRKNGRVYINAGGGITTSGAFVSAKNLQGRVGYFLREEWGLEFLYSKNSGEENKTALSVRNEGSSGSVPFRRIVDNYYGAMVLWSPFYSKINTFNTVVYVDWIFGLGYASLTETNNREEFINNQSNFTPTQETHSGIMWQAAMKFYLNENFDVRLNLATVHYKAPKASVATSEEAWNTNYDLSATLGYSF